MEPEIRQRAATTIETLLMDHDEALGMALRLSPSDSAYDLVYVGEKLALVASYMERLSDMQMRHTKIALAVQQAMSDVKSLRGLTERKMKASEEYAELALAQKGHWIDEQVQSLQEEIDVWSDVHRTVSEVRRGVLNRMEDMKRLESSIRLQKSIIEGKIAAGAMSISRIPGGHSKGDLDINLT